MSEVTKKSDTSSSQMRLLWGTPHMKNRKKDDDNMHSEGIIVGRTMASAVLQKINERCLHNHGEGLLLVESAN